MKLSNDLENSNSSPNDWYICRPNHNQNETPRGALLTNASAQMGPHSTHSIINSQRASAQKSPRRDADSSRGVGVSQGGHLFEDTAPQGGSDSGRFPAGNDVQNCGRSDGQQHNDNETKVSQSEAERTSRSTRDSNRD